MNIKRITWIIFFCLLHFSCSRPGPEKLKPSENVIRIAMSRGMDSLNPYLAMSLESELIHKRLFPSLFSEDPLPANEDGSHQRWAPTLTPFLVDSFAWDETGTQLTLNIKEGLKWSDGESLTAEDIAFTLSIQKDPEVAWIGAETKKNIKSWKIISALQLQVSFESACLLNMLDLNEGLIIPKHFYAQWKPGEWRNLTWSEHMVVFGPYRIESLIPNEKILLTPINPEHPRLGFAIIREKEMHYKLLSEQQLDYSWTLPTERFADITTSLVPACFPDNSFAFIAWNPIDPKKLGELELTSLPQLEQLKKSSPHPIFSDARVRQAMMLAMDRHRLIGTVLPMGTEIPVSPWALLATQLQVPAASQNLEKAADLLDQAGWKLENGLRTKEGVPLEFDIIVNSGNQLREYILLSLAEDMKKVGAIMHIRALEGSLYIQACFSRNFDAAFNLLRTGTHPDLTELFHSQSALNQGYNFASWTSIDPIIENISCQKDPDEILNLCRQAQDVFMKEQPLTILYRGIRMGGFSRDGVVGHPSELDPLFQIESWSGIPQKQ